MTRGNRITRIAKGIIAIIIFLMHLLMAMPAYAEGPIVLVSAVTEPQNVSPGDNFDLKLKVKNSGGSKANNLIITLGVDSISTSTPAPSSQAQGSAPSQVPISVVGESNVRYLGTLTVGGEKETVFKMVANGSAVSGTYNINVRLDYNGARAQSQIVGIVLIREADLRITRVSIPSSVKTDQRFKLTADIVNGGNYPVNSVAVEVSGGEAKIKSPNYFIGTLEAADSDTYETDVSFIKAGEQTLRLNVSYIDDFNRQHTIVKELRVKVKKAADYQTKGKGSDGFLSKLINFFKALLGLGGNQE
ncbi:MAG: hypothetical protein K6T91_03305 [Firmicutes bacterium]|nr:hypothetical protein [Bacillota bacterium]